MFAANLVFFPKNKTHRTLLISGLVIALAIAAGAGYWLRLRQIDRRTSEHRVAGMAALERQNYKTALRRIGTYLQRHPNDVDALCAYALARQNVDEPDGQQLSQAMRVYRYVLQLEPGRTDAKRALLDLYVRCSMNTETLSAADALLGADPFDRSAIRAKSVALMRLRRLDEAMPTLEGYTQHAPLDLDLQVATLEVMQRAGRPADEILRRAETLRLAHSNDVRFDILQSIAHSMIGEGDQAVEWARQAADRKPVEAEPVLLLVRQLDHLAMFDESFELLGHAVDQTGDPDLQRALVGKLIRHEQYDEVERRLAELPAESGDAELLAMRAAALCRLGRSNDATQILDVMHNRAGEPKANTWAKLLRAVYLAQPRDDKAVVQAGHAARRVVGEHPFIHALLADAYEALGDHETAMDRWRSAAHLAPAWPDPLVAISRTLMSLGRVDEAFVTAQAARARAPDDAEAMAALAVAWSAGARTGEANAAEKLLQLVNQIQGIRPGEADTLPIQIELLNRTGQRQQALAALDAALAMSPPPAEALLLRLAAVSRGNRLAREQQCYSLAEKTYGLTANIAFARARSSYDAGEPRKGLELLTAAMADPRHSPDAAWRIVWARYLELIKDPRAAETWVKLAGDLPDNVQVQWLVLSAASVQGDRAFVGQVLDRLQSLVGDQGLTVRLARARWLLQGQPSEKDTIDATVLLNEVTQANPDAVAARLLLANCFERLGNVSGAIEQMSLAASLMPDQPATSLELARLLQIQCEFDRSRAYLEDVIRSSSTTMMHLRVAAVLLARQGETDLALNLVKQLYEPEETPPDLLLASLYRQRNEPRKAEAIFAKLLESPDAAIIARAADFYAAQGKVEDAARTLARLKDLNLPAGAEPLLLGDFERLYGSDEKALALYAAATQADPGNASAWRRMIAFNFALGRVEPALEAARNAHESLLQDAIFNTIIENAALIQPFAGDEALRPLLVSLAQMEGTAAIRTLRILAEPGAAHSEASIARLHQLAQRHPRFMPLQVLLVERCLAHGRAEEAIEVATRAMQVFPSAAEPAQLAAVALAGGGRWSEALDAAHKWRDRSLSEPMAADIMIAEAQLNLGKPDDALRQLEPYISTVSESRHPRALIRYAEALILAGRAQDAAELLEPLLPRTGQWRATWIELSKSVPDPATAQQWLAEVQPHVPGDALDERIALAQAWQELAARSQDPQIKTSAAETLEQVADLINEKTGGDRLVQIAILHELQSDAAGAERLYRLALERDGSLHVAQNNLAMLLMQEGNLEGAVEFASAAAAAPVDDPNLPSFLETLSRVQGRRKAYEQAVTSLSQALRLKPEKIEWRINLAQMLVDSGQLDRASRAADEIDRLLSDEAQLSDEGRQTLKAVRQAVADFSRMQTRTD